MSIIYSFTTAAELIYGRGCVERLGEEVKKLGDKILLITGHSSLKKAGILSTIEKIFAKAGVEYVIYNRVSPEPELELVAEALQIIQREKCEVVVGIGGGSALDVAKAAAGLTNSPHSVYEHFKGKKVDTTGIPFVAIPTTAGTGAEVTPNSVLSDKEHQVKKSIRSPSFLADKVLVDPELMVSLPAKVTAYSGMDAFVQGIEAFTSKNANFLTDALSLKGVELVGRHIRRAYEQGDDIEAREAMAYGSLIIGVAFSNCRLGAVHGMAHPVGALYGVSHGLVCGTLLPTVMRFNLPVAGKKYAQIATALGISSDCSPAEAAEDLIKHIEELLKVLEIPAKLKKIGLREEDIPELARMSLPSGSLKANPRPVSYEDLVELFKQHL